MLDKLSEQDAANDDVMLALSLADIAGGRTVANVVRESDGSIMEDAVTMVHKKYRKLKV